MIMRKLISYAFVVAALLVAGMADAQDYAFRVLANKGTNQVKKAGSSQAQSLKTGEKLGYGDEIIASTGAYIGLMHKSGKTTEIRGAGTKKVSELEQNINTASTSITSRYASFVMNKLNESEGGGYRSQMKATGAVSRAAIGSAELPISAPESADLMGDVAVIRWTDKEGLADGDKYIVQVKNIFDDEIFSQETDKTAISFDFSDESLAYDMGLYLVKVYKKSDDDKSSQVVGIKKVQPEDKVEVQENLANLKSEVSEDSPLNKIIYASFYEENGLILDALTKYEEAIKMNPDIMDFQDMYKNFLLSHGLVSSEE